MFNHEDFKQTETVFNNIYLGVVENNNDPTEAGRVQIRIAGLHTPVKKRSVNEGIPTSELPWALPMMPVMAGGVSGLGYNGVPRQGDWVAIFFIGGDHNNPIYMGVIKGKPVTTSDNSKGFNDPEGVYPDKLNQPDWNTTTNEIKEEKNANLATLEPTAIADPVYTENTIFKSPKDGIVVEYDSTAGKERWQVYHKASKSYVEIASNGDMILKSTNNKFEIATSGRQVFVGNNSVEQVDGTVTETVGSTKSETVGGAVTETYNTSQTTNVDGNLVINVTGKVDIIGNEVDIDGGGTPAGVVQGACLCPFIAAPHIQVSSNVKASQ